MENGLRPTVRTPVPDELWPWPLPRGEPPYGEEPPERIQIERSVFSRLGTAVSAAALRAAEGRIPAGAADRTALTASIKADMEPWKTEIPRRRAALRPPGALIDPPQPVGALRASLGGGASSTSTWLTPGAAPMEATPEVPNAVA